MKLAHILTPTPIKGSWRPPSIDALKGVVEDSPRGSFLFWRIVFHPGFLFRRFVSQPGVFQQRAGVGLPGGLQGLRCSSFRMNLAFGTLPFNFLWKLHMSMLEQLFRPPAHARFTPTGTRCNFLRLVELFFCR